MPSPTARCISPHNNVQGFTLIEVMVSMAIVAILAGLAVPSFSDSMKRYRVNAAKDDLIASMQWARAEAIRRGETVTLIRQTGCGVALTDTNDWGCGWQTYQENTVPSTNTIGTIDTGETTLQVAGLTASYKVTHTLIAADLTRTGLGTFVAFNRWGQTTVGAQSFVVSPPEGDAASATRTICLSSGGRLKVLTGAVTCA